MFNIDTKVYPVNFRWRFDAVIRVSTSNHIYYQNASQNIMDFEKTVTLYRLQRCGIRIEAVYGAPNRTVSPWTNACYNTFTFGLNGGAVGLYANNADANWRIGGDNPVIEFPMGLDIDQILSSNTYANNTAYSQATSVVTGYDFIDVHWIAYVAFPKLENH